MHPKAKEWTAILAAAMILAYVSTAAVTQMHDYAFWSISLAGVGVFAAICGALLALVNKRAIASTITASAIATLIFAGLWSYIFWSFLGEYLSFLEIFISNLFFLWVLPQSALILTITTLSGLSGLVFVKAIVPERYQPQQL
ncbi:MAG: hypothetical protein GY832_24775 [Chloroflexi bacterium]|nr:hypothetical protein [Chloroflexota bacterium]